MDLPGKLAPSDGVVTVTYWSVTRGEDGFITAVADIQSIYLISSAVLVVEGGGVTVAATAIHHLNENEGVNSAHLFTVVPVVVGAPQEVTATIAGKAGGQFYTLTQDFSLAVHADEHGREDR